MLTSKTMEPKLFRPVNKKPKLKNGVVRFRCNLQEKAQWVRQSRRESMSLSQWITRKLNDEI